MHARLMTSCRQIGTNIHTLSLGLELYSFKDKSTEVKPVIHYKRMLVLTTAFNVITVLAEM